MKKSSSPHLTRATRRLDQALDELQQVITDRNFLEKRLEQSWKKLSARMKALARRWDQADHTAYGKLFVKHTALKKSLSKAQAIIARARQKFHELRDEYDLARNDLSARFLQESVDFNRLHRCQGALSRTFAHVTDRLKSNARPAISAPIYDVRDGEYDYIPYDVPGFLALLVRLDELLALDPDYYAKDQRYRPVSFLEIGCGPGRNLMIARESNLLNLGQLAGFDINPEQVALGKQAFGLADELQVADAMTFDYSAWDVVYSFRPFADNIMQIALEAQIARSMRKSAYLLAPLSQDLSLYHDLAQVGLSTDIWKKTG